GLKLVNGAFYTVLNITINKVYLGYYILADTILYFGPPVEILLAGEIIKDLYFISILPNTILLIPISTKIKCKRKRL
ncbi:hypothetical protein K432DRAFT_310035, partial [Lepidopterella palustris CBS 459.81]